MASTRADEVAALVDSATVLRTGDTLIITVHVGMLPARFAEVNRILHEHLSPKGIGYMIMDDADMVVTRGVTEDTDGGP